MASIWSAKVSSTATTPPMVSMGPVIAGISGTGKTTCAAVP